MSLSKTELKKEFRLLADVWQISKGYHAILLTTMVIQIILGIFPASMTFYIQQLFSDSSHLSELLSINHLLTVLGLLFVIIILKQGCSLLQGIAVANVKRCLELTYLNQLSKADYSLVHDTMTNRNVIAVSRESEMLTAIVPMTYKSFIQAPCTIIAFCLLMLFVSLKLTMIIVMLIVVVIACSFFLRRTIKNLSKALFERFSDLHQIFVEWLNGYRVFLLYDALSLMKERLSSVVDDTCKMSKSLMKINSIQAIAIETLTYGIVMIFLYAVSDQSTVGRWDVIISFPTAIMFIRKEAMHISHGYVQLASTESAIHYLHVRNEHIPIVKEVWQEPINQVALLGVSFSYQENIPVLSDASFQIYANGINVLIGPSGIGKSTTLDLIAGLRMPNKGRIIYNNEDISKYSVQSLLKRVAIVEQEPLLFEGSYLENIALDHQVDIKEILSYAHSLGLTRLISSETDLHKKVRCSGRGLSAGEKQRISFIRALVKHPDLFLLDEMTSNIDEDTSNIMIDYIESLAQEKIVLCVTHDPNVIHKASHTFEITKTRIVQRV